MGNTDNNDTKPLDDGTLLNDAPVKTTSFQKGLIDIISNARNGHLELTSIAIRAKTNRLAAYSSLKSLETKGIVRCWRSGSDQWAVLMYSLRR